MAVVLLAASLRAQQPALPEMTLTQWDNAAYEIEVSISADGSAVWTKARLDEVAEHLPQAARRTMGAAWHVSVAGATAQGVGAKSPAPSLPAKKVQLHLKSSGTAFEVEAQESDPLAGWQGPVVRREVAALSDLNFSCWSALHGAVMPQALVTAAKDDKVTVRLRAGGIPLRDDRAASLRVGAVLCLAPPAGAESTFLVVESTPGAEAVCHVVGAGSLSIVPGETLAFQVSPPGGSTRLRVVRRGDSAPLAALEVAVDEGANDAPQLAGRTDRQGEAVVPAGKSPLVYVTVSNESAPLARWPLVPGWPREQTIELDVSAEALARQAALAALRTRVLELAVRREAGQARAKARRDAGKAAEADQIAAALRKDVEAEGKQIQTAIEQQLAAAGDDAAEALWRELAESLRKELDRLSQ
ncbi:MAG: hypothetical protein HYS13_05220 [Planctomycetia bacterium]|nr:hypothetical protein [Planctomycetia bacterium]